MKKQRPKIQPTHSRGLGSLGEAMKAAGVNHPSTAAADSATDKFLGSQPPGTRTDRAEGHGARFESKVEMGAKEIKEMEQIFGQNNQRKPKPDSIVKVASRKSKKTFLTSKEGIRRTPKWEGSIFPEPPSRPVRIADDWSITKVQSLMDEIAACHSFITKEGAPRASAADEGEIRRRFETAELVFKPEKTISATPEILCIGFDFGSTATKIVLRFPYNESLGAFAVPAPVVLQADEHPYFWQSRVWRSEDGNYGLLTFENARAVERLKVDFLRARGNGLQFPAQIDRDVTAYIALMVRQSVGWLFNHLKSTLSEKSLIISANFGFPAEKISSDGKHDAYSDCCQAAMRLALSDEPVTTETLKDALAAARAGKLTNITVVPEFIGAVKGFFTSSRGKRGQYILCDFGGLTCDCVCFGFYERPDGSSIISIFDGRVRHFGAEIVREACAQGVPKDKIVAAIGAFVATPIREAYSRTGPNAPVWRGEMPLFQIGGGRRLPEYEGVFEWTRKSIANANFATSFRNEEIDLDTGSGLNLMAAKGRNNARLLVAFGLSHSEYELPEWLTSNQISPYPVNRPVEIESRYTGPEQT